MKKFLLLCFSFVFVISVWAQERVVSGKVTSAEDGSTLPGVNVVLKGTTNGTVTDSNGNYSLSVPANGGMLVFSFIGLQTTEELIGERSTVSVSLAQDVQQLTEVVITASGIERDKKALGYSVVGVSGDNIAQRSEPDPLRALQGKMPGVVISGSGGAPGQSTKINIRGFSSLTGNTQPLFIVDGVPFDNSINSPTDAATNATYSNRAFDLDPNNIESINILKGAAASALYGSRATNGVVVITTKSAKKNAKKGLEITYNGSYNVDQLSGTPDYQDVYTQGSNQVYNGGFIGNWGAPFPNHVDRLNTQYNRNYSKSYGTYVGGPLGGQAYPEGTAPHPLAGFSGVFPEFRDANGYAVPYEIKPHDIIGDFFRDGKTIENGIGISSGSDKASINAGFSTMKNDGIIPSQEATRTSVYFGGNGQLENGLFISGNLNYVNSTQLTPPTGGIAFDGANYGGGTSSVYARIFYLPRNYDLGGLPFENPANGNNIFYRGDLDNPFWVAKYNYYSSDVNRVYGNLALSYDIKEWLNVLVRGGINQYHDKRKNVLRAGGNEFPLGQLWNEDLNNREVNYDAIATLSKDLSERINLKTILGFNANERLLTRRRVTGTQTITNQLNLVNSTTSQVADLDFTRLRRLIGAFFDVSIAYNNYLFLNLVGRNDWSSTLPKGGNSFFYPGASVSLVFTDALNLELPWLNSGKIRGAVTKVGLDADPYLTSNFYNIDPAFVAANGNRFNQSTLSNRLANAQLKPEFTTEVEGGIELQMFNGKVGFDATYFNRRSTEQIIASDVARSSGFSEQIVNIGELENRGWEIGIDLTPISLDNGFKWNTYVAFTRIRTEVLDAGPTGQIFLGGVTNTLGTIHKNGFPYGQIFGTVNQRDDEGNLLINPQTGLPFPAQDAQVIGDPNPDFLLGFNNTFTWKGFTLRALIDWRQGGDIYSFTGGTLLLRGQLKLTEDREALRVAPGVLGDPSTGLPILDENNAKIVNTIPISAFDSHFTNGWGVYGQDEVNIYDATVIRLREVSLGYSIPKSVLSKTPFGSATITLSGRNLWWRAPNMLEGLNADPEVNGETADSNRQGFDYGSNPTIRRFGVNISLTF
jgi:TonB-linked SusC/RagA family outer membrane protein